MRDFSVVVYRKRSNVYCLDFLSKVFEINFLNLYAEEEQSVDCSSRFNIAEERVTHRICAVSYDFNTFRGQSLFSEYDIGYGMVVAVDFSVKIFYIYYLVSAEVDICGNIVGVCVGRISKTVDENKRKFAYIVYTPRTVCVFCRYHITEVLRSCIHVVTVFELDARIACSYRYIVEFSVIIGVADNGGMSSRFLVSFARSLRLYKNTVEHNLEYVISGVAVRTVFYIFDDIEVRLSLEEVELFSVRAQYVLFLPGILYGKTAVSGVVFARHQHVILTLFRVGFINNIDACGRLEVFVCYLLSVLVVYKIFVTVSLNFEHSVKVVYEHSFARLRLNGICGYVIVNVVYVSYHESNFVGYSLACERAVKLLFSVCKLSFKSEIEVVCKRVCVNLPFKSSFT